MNTGRPAILFLVHRIPYPPNKGDKIRSFNILKMLSKHYRVFLATFVDEPEDKIHINELSNWCEGVIALNQNKTIAKLKGLSGFLTNQAISIPYYSNRKLKKWIKNTIEVESIERCLVFSGVMAQFLNENTSLLRSTVIDFVDVDSDKWHQYAENKSGVKRWFYLRESRLLSKFEHEYSLKSAFSTFVSEDEANVFINSALSPPKQKVRGIRNGVDTDFFDVKRSYSSSVEIKKNSVVFTGAMDYWANIDAVMWFSKKVWPIVLEKLPDATLYIVGSRPSTEVNNLNGKNNTIVTGRVEDVRPFIANAKLSVAPLRIARGIQNKVLEALSMSRPIILTSMAAEGISDKSVEGYWIEDDSTEMAQKVLKVLINESISEFPEHRVFVQSEFSWDSEMRKLADLIEQGVQS
jgi:sugar transferase (PEP-CTERM/EpsH1 system associated)